MKKVVKAKLPAAKIIVYSDSEEDVIESSDDEKIVFKEINKPIRTNELEKILYNEENLILQLNEFELNILVNSFNEVCRQIEDWEFQTRIGVTRQEVKSTINKLINEFKK